MVLCFKVMFLKFKHNTLPAVFRMEIFGGSIMVIYVTQFNNEKLPCYKFLRLLLIINQFIDFSFGHWLSLAVADCSRVVAGGHQNYIL